MKITNKIIDCITFYSENFIFDFRYNVIKDYVDFLVVCESKFDHRGNPKQLNFDIEKYSNDKKIKYIILEDKFPNNSDPWNNQALQRDYILKNLTFADDEDYIFFSDPDEIPNTKLYSNFKPKNMEFFCKNHLIINSIFLISTKLPGMALEFAKKKT